LREELDILVAIAREGLQRRLDISDGNAVEDVRKEKKMGESNLLSTLPINFFKARAALKRTFGMVSFASFRVTGSRSLVLTSSSATSASA
jgi:hypothetical protein